MKINYGIGDLLGTRESLSRASDLRGAKFVSGADFGRRRAERDGPAAKHWVLGAGVGVNTTRWRWKEQTRDGHHAWRSAQQTDPRNKVCTAISK